MSVVLAKTAGFCFGVNRAINIIEDLLNENKKVCTLGPIIHNKQMVDSLFLRGVRIVDSIENVKEDETLVIRSHGVPLETMDNIKKLNINYVDATCPFVSKIHKIVYKSSLDGKVVLIAGNIDHPEVQGIRGHCLGESFVFKNLCELEKLFEKNEKFNEKSLIVVSQTTFSVKEWQKCLNFIKKVCTNIEIFDTICIATEDRQREAEELSKNADLMVIVGGKHSSNTVKLKEICHKNCKTILIETAEELSAGFVESGMNVAVTAGASTPEVIIKEVLEKMAYFSNNDEVEEKKNSDEELRKEREFEEMLEESLKSLNSDSKVRGKVVGITPSEIAIDVEGRKQSGFMPISELSLDSDKDVEDLVKLGDELDLLIMRTDDQEGTLMLSKKRMDIVKSWDEVVKAYDTGKVLRGQVVNVLSGGVIVNYKGVRVFVPASLATETRRDPIDGLLNKLIEFKVIEINIGRKRAVGSARAVYNAKREKQLEKFWETAEIGKSYVGVVKTITSYGVFVDIGGIDGMVHVSELSWERVEHPEDVVKVGDVIDVYIKDIDRANDKIALGCRKPEDNPWLIIKKHYHVGQEIEVEIVGMNYFGAFGRILPGIDGLIHISQISDRRIDKPQDELELGQKVNVIITNIDLDRKRISLSIKQAKDKEFTSSFQVDKDN